MSETSFFVRPLDVAFFGPPEAQSAGDTHYSRSLFPPPPRAFQGLVRSRLLSAAQLQHPLDNYSPAAQQEREKLVGNSDTLPPGWQIEGPIPVSRSPQTGEHKEDEPLVPWVAAPAFLVQRPDQPGTPQKARWIEITPDDHATGGVAGVERPFGQHVLGTRGFTGQPLAGWIDAANLFWALTGEGCWKPEGHQMLPPIVKRELRVGLAVNRNTRQAEDRMLYAVDQLRFDGQGGFVGTLRTRENLPPSLSADALTHGTAPFGRWHRLAALEPTPRLTPVWTNLTNGTHLPQELEEGTLFWMVAITPWRLDPPPNSAPEQSALQPRIHSVEGANQIEILGALLGKSITLGGFSMAHRQARPNQIYVPAGSAWMFTIPHVTPAQRGMIVRQLNGSHCLGPEEEARMGFGRVLVGLSSK